MTRPQQPVAECPLCPATYTSREWPAKRAFLVCTCGALLCRDVHVHIDGAEPRVCRDTGDLLWVGVLGDVVHRVSADDYQAATKRFTGAHDAVLAGRKSKRKLCK